MVKKILITGGKGYVGGRLCEHLSKHRDYKIIVTSRSNKNTLNLPNVEIVAIDYEKDDFKDLLEGVDTLIHLAALNEIDCVKEPYKAIDFNVKMTLKWLKAAENKNIRKFIYFSTVHVYGPNLSEKITEESLTRPTHPYSITHKAAEDYVLASRSHTPIDTIVVRLSNSFGRPHDASVNRWTLLVNDLCKKVVNTNELVLKSDGQQQRDFIPLTDVVNAISFLIKRNKTETDDGLFNLCSGKSVSVYDMTKKIAENFEKLFKTKPKIIRPTPENKNIRSSIFSIKKLNDLGFYPSANVDKELQDMLLFCSNEFKVDNNA